MLGEMLIEACFSLVQERYSSFGIFVYLGELSFVRRLYFKSSFVMHIRVHRGSIPLIPTIIVWRASWRGQFNKGEKVLLLKPPTMGL